MNIHSHAIQLLDDLGVETHNSCDDACAHRGLAVEAVVAAFKKVRNDALEEAIIAIERNTNKGNNTYLCNPRALVNAIREKTETE